MRLLLIAICFVFSVLSMGMSFAPTSADISYNNLKLGDNYEQMVANFGKPRYTETDYLWGQKVTYYVYKNNNKIAISDDTHKVVDMIIVDDTYEKHTNLIMGMTSYKIEQTFGKTPRQAIDGKVCYVYENSTDKTKLVLQVEPTEKYLEALRITSLPIDLPQDNTAYLPDNATDESENPMIADKTIDTSAVAPDKKSGKFQINYNYSITK